MTMAVYLTKKQQDRKSAKGDKYLPHACARCGCGIRVTPGRTAGGSCHGDTGKARKVCDALLAARILEQGEEAEEDESEEDSEDRSAEQSEAEGSEEGEEEGARGEPGRRRRRSRSRSEDVDEEDEEEEDQEQESAALSPLTQASVAELRCVSVPTFPLRHVRVLTCVCFVRSTAQTRLAHLYQEVSKTKSAAAERAQLRKQSAPSCRWRSRFGVHSVYTIAPLPPLPPLPLLAPSPTVLAPQVTSTAFTLLRSGAGRRRRPRQKLSAASCRWRPACSTYSVS
eukprot:COSAG03_NODE_2989_length_2304_cov_15.298731_1_plen_283_part_00